VPLAQENLVEPSLPDLQRPDDCHIHPLALFYDEKHQEQVGEEEKKKKGKAGGKRRGVSQEGELMLRRFFDNLNSLIIVWTFLYHTKKGGKK